jgi:hypothetical protein
MSSLSEERYLKRTGLQIAKENSWPSTWDYN